MAVTEHGRFVLYRHFEAEMGEEKARTLMDHLLPVGWTDLVTKQDLRLTAADLRHEMAKLKQEMAELRQELAHVRETMATKIDIAEVRLEISELRGEMHRLFRVQTLALVGTMATMQGVTVAALKFL